MKDDSISRQELLDRTINNPLHPPYITERDVLDCPSAQPTLYGYDIKQLAFVASIMVREGVSPEEAVAIFRDINRVIEMALEDIKETWKTVQEQWEGAKDGIAEEAEEEV